MGLKKLFLGKAFFQVIEQVVDEIVEILVVFARIPERVSIDRNVERSIEKVLLVLLHLEFDQPFLIEPFEFAEVLVELRRYVLFHDSFYHDLVMRHGCIYLDLRLQFHIPDGYQLSIPGGICHYIPRERKVQGKEGEKLEVLPSWKIITGQISGFLHKFPF